MNMNENKTKVPINAKGAISVVSSWDEANVLAAARYVVVMCLILPVPMGTLSNELSAILLGMTLFALLLEVAAAIKNHLRLEGYFVYIAALGLYCMLSFVVDMLGCYHVGYNYIGLYLRTVLFILLLNNSKSRGESKECIVAVSFVCIALTLGNTASIIFFPSGVIKAGNSVYDWQPMYLLNNPNQFAFYQLAYLYISALCGSVLNRNVKIGVVPIMIWLLSVVGSLLPNERYVSTAGIIVLALAGLGLFLVNRSFIYRFRKVFLIIAMLMPVIVLFSASFHMQIISALESIGISTGSLQARFGIWGYAISEICESFLAGHGTTVQNFALEIQTGLLRSAHNNFLQILYYTGAIGLVLFLFATFTPVYSLGRNKHNSHNQLIWTILISAISSYFVLFCIEQMPYCVEYFVMLAMGIYSIACLGKQDEVAF